ncbi:hypothetical protein NDU88_003490 [Pleurodeles waltl]|uniref:Uncharacterized protein n=1 Tax=Pleurodeles waltl TaxID=8319 RepID=A0AAV7LFH7_PLEWA|nr:hypothetical protein NDU88_003490 [Pleurodeles waltl]
MLEKPENKKECTYRQGVIIQYFREQGAEGALQLFGPTGISAASPRWTRPSQSRVRGRRDPRENFPTTGDRGSVSPAPGAPGEESESGCEGAVGLKTGSAESLPGARRAHTPSSQQRLQSAPGESASTQPANEQHTPPRRVAACVPTDRPQAPAPARGHKRLLRPRGKRTRGETTGRGEVRAADCGRGAGSRTRVPRSVGTL